MSKLVSAAWDEPYVHLEDVFFTGILAEKLGIPRRLAMELKNNAERVPNHFLGRVQQSPLSSQFAFQGCNLPQLLSAQKY